MLAKNVRVELVRDVAAGALLVDVDDAATLSRHQLAGIWRMRLAKAGYRVRKLNVFRSRRHRHAVIVVQPTPTSLYEVIALQLLLGSDGEREANNLRRVQALPGMLWAERMVNVLYEPF